MKTSIYTDQFITGTIYDENDNIVCEPELETIELATLVEHRVSLSFCAGKSCIEAILTPDEAEILADTLRRIAEIARRN